MKTKLKSILAIALCAVGLAAFAEPDAVQLWENGPYFATCNVGANKPEDYGFYFWWGDTVGYKHDGTKWVSVADDTTSIQFAPTDATAKTTEGKTNAELKSMGYINDDANPVLNAAHDAATAHLGEPWRMPTKDELDKLVANCEVEWTDNWDNTGVKGLIVKGKGAFASNRIFLPATGYGSFFSVNFAGVGGHNGASTPDSDGSNAWCLNFNSSLFSAYKDSRYNGSPVRAVKDPPTPPVVAQFVKGGEVVAEFGAAAAAVAALDDAKYADIEEFRIGLAADTVFDFGGRTNRVVILNFGDVENTLKNVLLDCAGDYVVTGMVGTVVFGDGVRIEKETGFTQGLVNLIIKGGLYKSDPSRYCEDGYCGARRCDANAALNGLYAILPEAEIAVTVSKGLVPTRYATLQDAFNLIGVNEDVTLRLFNNLELGTAVTKLEGNKTIHLLPGEAGANTIKRVGAEPVIEIGREAKLEIKNVIFDGANVPSENPMIEVAGKGKPPFQSHFGWLIAGDGFVVSNAVGGAVHVGDGGKFELDGVAKIIENTTGGKPKNVIIEDSKAIQLTDCGAVTDGNYAQIGVWSGNPKFMIPGGQFGTVNKSFADGDILVAKPWVGFINDLDGTLHHAAGAAIAAAPAEPKKTYKRWVGGKYKELVEEGYHLISRDKSIVSVSPELVWTARQDAPAAQPAPAVLDWTDTTLTLAVSNGCDYALVTSGSAETNWVSMVKTDNTYAFARPAGDDYLCLRRYSITPSNIVSAATAYSVRVAAGTEGDPWLVGAENPEDVTAWTNGNEFVVSGDGTVSDLSKLASKVTVEKLTIKDATVTVAASDAFQGFGASGSEVSLSLPDGWQGELPDKDGNWYGATVTLTAMPLTVKNVTFLQRYPWNGKVDVGFDVTGPEGATNVVVTVSDGETTLANFMAAVTIPEDGVLATNLVWDADAAGLAANFKSDDVTVEVAIAASAISAKSAAGTVDLTVGVDRVAKDIETLVVDPAWGNASEATVKLQNGWLRTYTCASNDLWDTTALEPGRHGLAFRAGETDVIYGAFFWKLGAGWVVFDSSNITADVTFEAGKTYLMLGTNTASSATLTVTDGAKFEYGEGAGFLGGTVAGSLPKRYEQKTVAGELYRIVEKIKGSEDNPWTVGEGVEAWTNGTELVIGGNGTVAALTGVDGLYDLLAGLTAINVTSNGVTGAASDAFQGVGDGEIALTLPDGWQGELPDEGGAWYGATDVTLTAMPLTVRNVAFQQRYPWNGKVDIGFGVTGPVGETNVVITAYTNGTVKIASYVAAVTIPASGVLATNLVWDAEAAGLAANFKSDDVTVEVKIDESDIAAKSEAGALDLRTAVTLDKGAVRIEGVSHSTTAWGAAAQANVALGWTNKTTDATGVFDGADDLEDGDPINVSLPKKNGDYRLTHSTGGLTSFVKFTVTGYPLGCETNPWEIGAGDNPENVVAWTDGNGNVYFKPARSTVSRMGLEAVTNAMGGVSFQAKLIAADGSVTNDLVMVLGASGTVYDTIAEALYADEASCTLFDVNGYLVSYNGGEGALGTMATDTFIPTVPTNLTANAYEIIGYRFDGWTNAVAGVFYTNRQEGVDFAQPGETLALTALWTQVELEPTGYDELTNMLAKVMRPAKIKIVSDIEIPAGGKIVVSEGKSVTFAGTGKFDVSAERPALFDGYPVGTGLKPEDLGRFVTDKDVKAYFEDGKVVVRGRGETEEFPWLLGTAGHEDEVKAWAGDEMVLTKPTRGTASVAAFQSVTNALSGYVPGLGELKVISADGTATNNVVMLLGSDGVPYDTLADVLAANPMPETVRLFEVKGYFVSYDANGAAGTMATDTFVPTIPTNLTANAYSAVGYAFAGWTTNGSDKVAYADRAAGVDFAQPGETLALTAKWTDTGATVATFDALTNALVAATNQAATLPVTVNLTGDITVPQGGVVKVYASPAVTFTGDGKFDVSDIVPQFGEPVTVGEGLAEGNLDRFDADGVSKPVFEDGKVVLHARGESADFPWVLDGAKGVTAWVDLALTNLAAVVIDNGMPTATNEIDLVALTNNLAVYGYEPAKTPLNALLAVGKDGGAPEYVKPVNWIGEGGKYATLEAALAAGKTAVVPNFVTEEIPEEIVETGTGDDGETYTAVVENKPAEDVEEPVKATYAEGLLNIATNVKQNVKLEVTPTNVEDVAQQTVTSLTNVLLSALAIQEGHPMRIMETNMVDLSVYYNETKQTTLNKLIAIHIPWTIQPGITYGISRIHDGVAQAIPEAQPPVDLASDTECFVVDKTRNEIVLYVKNFSDYLIAGTMPLVPRIGASIKWKLCYATGSLFAQLKLAVTNGQASAVENLKFVFEDRADGSKLWGASSDRSQQGAVLTGWTGLPAGTWRYVNVDGDALTAVKGGNTGTFGVQSGIDTANGTVASADRKIELYKKNAVISADDANEFLGWVVWKAYGEEYCAPVGSNAPMVANVAKSLRAPLSVAGANKAAAYGNAYLMDGSDPDCEIAAFTVGEGTIRVRIALKGVGGKENAPGGNVKATLYGATSLDGGFVSCGTIPLAADGTFETPIPAGKAFFRVKLEVVDVIK